jgi:hypothetical protein
MLKELKLSFSRNTFCFALSPLCSHAYSQGSKEEGQKANRVREKDCSFVVFGVICVYTLVWERYLSLHTGCHFPVVSRRNEHVAPLLPLALALILTKRD